MTLKRRQDDQDSSNNTMRNIIASIILFAITGWVLFVTTSAIINKENNQKLSGEVAVIANDHKNLNENVLEIKQLVVDIRRDQIRRYGK